MTGFTPRLDILPDEQRAVWPLLAQVPAGFVLYGGTALALRLGHRESVDFDFFTSRSFRSLELRSAMPFLEDGTVAQGEADTLTTWVMPLPTARPVKLSFFGGLTIPVIERPDIVDPPGVVVASLIDLAGTKVKVIHQRIELKDYRDIVSLLDGGLTLGEIVAAAQAIFPKAITFVDAVSSITFFEEGESVSFPEPLKKRLRSAARGISPAQRPKPQYPSIEAAAAAVGR